MKFTVLVDNKTESFACNAEWGLAILIETGNHKILFDAGASSMFVENAKRMKVDLSDVDALVISHGHYDHTEGVPAFTKINQTASIYLHKDALGDTYGESDGKIEDFSCGIRWSPEYLDSILPRIVFTENKFELFENASIVGNVPWLPASSPTERFFRKIHFQDRDGKPEFCLTQDDMRHEQFLVIEEEKGLYIFSGCSHKGPLAILSHAAALFPDKKIAGFIAGMHMYPLSSKEQDHIIDTMMDMEIEELVPLHCTGMNAILKMKARKGSQCIVAAAGNSYEL